MVLPAPAAPDAPAPADHAFAERLKLILRLGEAGVLVLVDRARPEQLGRFVRTVMAFEPKLEVLTSALGLARAEPGSAIVLLPDLAEAAWMNQERPVLASRRLRVILYCDERMSAGIARKAPDFFHWTSHWMEAPKGAWPPAVRGLRAAERRGEPVAWMGGNFEEAFSEAFGGTEPARLSASKPYLEILEAFRKEEQWLVVTDVEGQFRLRRVNWALEESGRKGRIVLLEPKGDPVGFARVHARMMDPEEAAKRLAEAGAKHAGRLAAILDCEEEVVDVAARLLRGGAAEAEVEGVWREEDPEARIWGLAGKHGVEAPRAEVGSFEIGDWLAVAQEAVEAGDAEVGEHWARKALEQGENRADAFIVVARAITAPQKFDESIANLGEAIKLSQGADPSSQERRMTALAMLSTLHSARGELKDARRAIDSALRLCKTLPDEELAQWRPLLLVELAEVLQHQGDVDGARRSAEKAVREAIAVAGTEEDRNVSRALEVLAQIALDNDEWSTAKEAMVRAARINDTLFGKEHPLVGRGLVGLAVVLAQEGDVGAAQQLLRRAVDIYRRSSHSGLAVALTELGSVLLQQGELDEAQALIEEACRMMAASESPAVQAAHARALHQLSGVLVVKGNLEEARSKIEEALIHAARALPRTTEERNEAAMQVDLAYILLELGEYVQGLELVRNAHRTLLRKLGPEHAVTKSAADLLSRVAPPGHAPGR